MNIRAVLLLVALSALPCVAQRVSDYGHLREEILNDYNTFRRNVLDGYATYLEGVWNDYLIFRGEERNHRPKPKAAPVLSDSTPKPKHPIPKPVKTPVPQPDLQSLPTVIETLPEPADKQESDRFLFYDIPVDIPHADLKPLNTIRNKSEFATQWRSLSRNGIETSKALAKAASEMDLNDYLTFEMVLAWANETYPGISEPSRLSLAHFMLTSMGYDIRLASSSDGTAMLLIPFRQKIYGRPYLTINGCRYYAFLSQAGSLPALSGSTLSTCDIPAGINPGKTMDLRLTPLKLPYRPYKFHLTYGGINIEGEMNANIFPLLYHYPQMPMADYALSVVDADIRKSVIGSISSQIKSDTPRTVADTLLCFVQNAFEYATDGNNHGFEKPYFFEEMLFYPKCDCEDRAIFYSALLWHGFRLENHIIHYPGHESVAVRLNDGQPGDFYTHKNGKFYISDPTFIGARTGMSMPEYREIKPEIDHIYSEK